ncbi:HRDC domain-containing protein [Cnuibacter physcomitrellae]|uniref:HRDC domain-containing protein n=1 Tax=Cnuibacter physcomitrellae TaxID=1619308 RepID=UPI002176055D|nr:HRDC domain-containing protein [Cnuibacter physcomitrellae]MCS5496851.1 HRDC domain-containing protein [Cnuibacter physcomitrellae]
MSDAETFETPQRSVIADVDDFHDAVEELALGHGPVAVDAERASGFRYSQRAYLIQVYRRGAGTYLFDPPAIGEFAPLQSVIGDAEWVLHAASQDLPCLREVGLDPVTVFDTELAARLLGLPRVGLGAVVEELLGIHLAKEHSAADWSTRPLPASWLEYAALDVELLLDLRDSLAVLLKQQGKERIAAEEFAAVVAKEEKPPLAEPWRRLSGIHSLRPDRHLAAARELWLARDALARELDVSPGRLVPDTSLIAAARALPESRRDLAALKQFSGRASRTELDRWWSAIERARTTDDIPVQRRSGGDTLPPPRSWGDRNPEADLRLKAARAALTEIATERAIPLENLLTPDFLRRVAWEPPAEITPESVGAALAGLGARPWQIELTAQTIARAFVEGHQEPAEGAETDS